MPPKKSTTAKKVSVTAKKSAKTTATKKSAIIDDDGGDTTNTVAIRHAKTKVGRDDMDVNEIYSSPTPFENIRNTNWAAGNKDPIASPELLIDSLGNARIGMVRHSPVFYKCFDEAVVNAADHLVNMIGVALEEKKMTKLVTYIDISFDEETGQIRVYNNGPGPTIVKHKDASEREGETIYVPTMIFGIAFAGTNSIDRDPYSITGGANGLGAKICNAFSTNFEAQCIDGQKRRFYQQWDGDDRLSPCIGKDIDLPLSRLDDETGKPVDEPHCCIQFDPRFDLFGYNAIRKKQPKFFQSQSELLRGRCYMLAARLQTYHQTILAGGFTARTKIPDLTIRYNGENIPVKAICDIAKLLYPAHVNPDGPKISVMRVVPSAPPPEDAKKIKKYEDAFAANGSGSDNTSDVGRSLAIAARCTHPWNVVVVSDFGESDENDEESDNTTAKAAKPKASATTPRSETLAELAMVNGVITKTGTHIKHVYAAISERLGGEVQKKLKRNDKVGTTELNKFMFVIIDATIPCPGWDGQRKDKISMPASAFKYYGLNYFTKIKDANTAAGGDADGVVFREKELINMWTDNYVAIVSEKSTRKKKMAVEKYIGAGLAGNKKYAGQCVLIPVEGDSAKGQVDKAIATHKLRDYYGTISTGGVIHNPRKHCRVITLKNGTIKRYPSSATTKDKFVNSFMTALNLDFSKSYDPDAPDFDEQMKTLRYGRVLICVDQDMDGKGQILGLIVNFFDCFWPGLLKAGFVGWIPTPIIRALPKGGTPASRFPGGIRIMKSFYTVPEYDDWARKFAKSGGEPADLYTIKYYKGLAGHSERESNNMFAQLRDPETCGYIFEYDDLAAKTIEIFYGEDTGLRKKELSLPFIPKSEKIIREETERRIIRISDQFLSDTREYQGDNIERKMLSIVDGQHQAGRKMLAACILKTFATDSGEVKIPTIPSDTTKYMAYHHGPTSMENTVVGKCFIAIGGVQLPFLICSGQYGSRICGGETAGAPRYMHVKLNKKITNLIFPKEDMPLLEYRFDDGARSEPKFFVPTIPLAVLEHFAIPATGWKSDIWPRRLGAVIEAVRNLITSNGKKDGNTVTDVNNPEYDLPLYTYDKMPTPWKGEHGTYSRPYKKSGNKKATGKGKQTTDDIVDANEDDGDENADEDEIGESVSADTPISRTTETIEYTRGDYKVGTPDEKGFQWVTVVEFPLFVWNNKIARALDKRLKANETDKPDEYIVAYTDANSTAWTIEFSVKFRPGAVAKLREKVDQVADGITRDGIEKILGLFFENNKRCINYIDEKMRVITLSNYREAVEQWFPHRRDLYVRRCERDMMLKRIKIKFENERLRYIDLGVKTNELTDDEAEALFEENEFPRINRGLMESPGYTDVELLWDLVFDCEDDPTHCNYAYLFSVTDGDKTTAGRERIAKRLATLKAELADYKKTACDPKYKFHGARFWLDELDELEKIAENGVSTNWTYGIGDDDVFEDEYGDDSGDGKGKAKRTNAKNRKSAKRGGSKSK